MRLFASVFLMVVLMLSVLSCSSQPVDPKTDDPNQNPPVNRTTAEMTTQEISVLESSNKFGIKLFKAITEKSAATENVFFSPLSVSYALALCYNGAKGDTRDAIGATLELADLSIEDLNQAYKDATQILINADELVDFRVANSFWSRQGKAIHPEFITLAQTYHDARVEEINFLAPWAADTINAWVDRSTNGKIKEMVKPPISSDVAAMLFNAIYFKGSWMFPFDTAFTRDAIFHLADGSENNCRMMGLSEADCLMENPDNPDSPVTDTNVTYYQDDEVFVLGMPYGAGDYRMSIILPNRLFGYPHNDTGRSIDEIIQDLTNEKWASWMSGQTPGRFTLGLPRIKFGCEMPLGGLLKTLGMEIAFNPMFADFSNMFVDGVGWIDKVKQKTFIQVDEKGTEAAAVTQVTMIDSMPPSLICDKPFLIVIHEDNSGAILFMGRISDPVWQP